MRAVRLCRTTRLIAIYRPYSNVHIVYKGDDLSIRYNDSVLDTLFFVYVVVTVQIRQVLNHFYCFVIAILIRSAKIGRCLYIKIRWANAYGLRCKPSISTKQAEGNQLAKRQVGLFGYHRIMMYHCSLPILA